MAKGNAKTDNGAFNALRFGKTSSFGEQAAQIKREQDKALEELQAFIKAVKSDSYKLAAKQAELNKASASKEAKLAAEEKMFSGAPEFSESRKAAGIL